MGVDVELMARAPEPLTDEDIEAIAFVFSTQFPTEWEDYPRLVRADKWEAERDRMVVIATLDRFYGPDYARGPWPKIRAMGDWLMVRFGESGEVRYGGDGGDGWVSLTPYPVMRQECDEHWATKGLPTRRVPVAARSVPPKRVHLPSWNPFPSRLSTGASARG